jgi:hypothetical protein
LLCDRESQEIKMLRRLSKFVSNKTRREIIGWLISVLATFAAGMWALFTYIFPHDKQAITSTATVVNPSGSVIAPGAVFNGPISLSSLPEPKPQNEATLLVDCRMSRLPTRAAPGSTLYHVSIFDTEGGGEVGTAWQPIGDDGKVAWPSNRTLSSVWRCEITNFEDYPIFSVTMKLKVQFFDVVKDSQASSRSGDQISFREWPIGVTDLRPRVPVVFYAISQSKFYVTVSLPPNAEYMRGADDTKRTNKLRPPGFTAMSFFPSEMIPPTATKN